ncbi:MAG: sulfotransferase domain-containing protein [Candidatus Sulfotelmatobacter sp.]
MITPWKKLRYRATRTWLRDPIVWLRHRGLDSSDVYLAEFPRSGSTWLRFILVEILTGEPAGFLNVNSAIPEIGTHGRARPILPGGGRLIKTHEPYRRNYRRAIYLVRDVRDVLFSVEACDREFGWANYFSHGRDFDGYLESFLNGGTMRFRSWQGHVHSFLDSPTAASGNMLLVHYEEMRRNTEATLLQILEFLEVDADPSAVRNAIANNTLERMRAKEDSVKKPDVKLTKGTLLRGHKKGRFVGKGALGGWREKLTPEQLQLIDRYAGDAMQRLGYPLSSQLADAGDQELPTQLQER